MAPIVDILMPMMYTKFGISNSLELRLWMFELKWFTTVLRVVPIVRGWAISQDANGFLSDLTSDIKAARESGADGIAIFTYESMLKSATSTTMESIKDRIAY